MIDASNKQQRRASTSIQCKDPFLSATLVRRSVEVEELELEHNINIIDLLIHDQDIHTPMSFPRRYAPIHQNRAEDRYEEEVYRFVAT